MLKMLSNNILIKEQKKEEKFGIKSDSLSVKANVINTGPDVIGIFPGDVVYISIHTGTPYKDMRIIQDYDVFGKEE